MTDLNNKLVWITGASSGIGEALSLQLAQMGAKLILSSRSVEKLEQLRDSLPNADRHHVLPLDVSDRNDIQQKAEQYKELIGQTQVLINNAGISQRALAWEATEESERKVMETNFFGAVALAKLVVPGMMKRNEGHIVVISSVVGKMEFSLRTSYAASKHALHGYFDSMRVDLKDYRIGVTMVCPGRIKTNISFNALTSDGTQHGKMDPGQAGGIPAEKCASRIISAVQRDRAEIYIGKEQILIYLKRFWPGAFRRIVTRIKPN